MPKPDIFTKGYVASYLQQSPHEKTNTSIASLNSLALDKINQRNEDRMQRLGLAMNDRGDISTSGLDFTQNSLIKGGDDHLKKVDNVLFDILRSKEPPPSQGQSRRLPSANRFGNGPSSYLPPKMGPVFEEEYEGTFKRPPSGRRADSLFGDTTNLALR